MKEELKLDLMKKFKKLNVAEYTTKYGDYYGLMFAGAEIATKKLEKENERHSPDEHIDKDRVVLGIIKHCNKLRYSLVQWNGEWWYQYGTYNAEVRLIAWYNIPELKENE